MSFAVVNEQGTSEFSEELTLDVYGEGEEQCVEKIGACGK